MIIQPILSRAYAAWAKRAGFVEHGNDARYRGTLDRVGVIIDNGVRASGCYGVEVWLAIATGDPPGPIRKGSAAPPTALGAAILAVMAAEEGMIGARIEADAVVLRLAAEQEPEQTERIVRSAIAACRPAPPHCGPYR
jgi:hypothetical protein